MNTDLLQNIVSKHDLHLLKSNPLSGGDINKVYLIKCASESYVIKLNKAAMYPGMFESEAKGLELLSASESFKIPKVIAEGIYEDHCYLILEHISIGTPSEGFALNFAEKLSKLHHYSQRNFGLDHDNYIGSLPQYNSAEKKASEFYINQRLEPQFKMAVDRGFKFSDLSGFFKRIEKEIPNEAPSLIHGDLWGGNNLVSEAGQPVLIDPAVAFAPREMDLAMMQLFGGFSDNIFSEYNLHFPLLKGWQQRVKLYQLYYLLVHLNIFGKSYLSQVTAIVKRYS